MKKKTYLIPLVLVLLGLFVPVWYAVAGAGKGTEQSPTSASVQPTGEESKSQDTVDNSPREGDTAVSVSEEKDEPTGSNVTKGNQQNSKSVNTPVKQSNTPTQTKTPGGGETVVPPKGIKVDFAVVGKGGSLLKKSVVTIPEDNEWGYTPLGALTASGVEYKLSTRYKGFVDSICGQKNEGMSGWMFAVNGTALMSGASSCKVKAGDKVIWYYSEKIGDDPPKL